MSTRDEFNSLTAAFKVIADENTVINEAFWEITDRHREQIIDLKRKLILEEDLLKLIKKWTLEPNGAHVYLSAEEDSLRPTPEIEPLISLTQDGYHSDFALMDGVHLHFSDGDITINFEDPLRITDFVEKFQLVVDTSKVRDEANNLQNVVDSLWRLHTYASHPYANVPNIEERDL